MTKDMKRFYRFGRMAALVAFLALPLACETPVPTPVEPDPEPEPEPEVVKTGIGVFGLQDIVSAAAGMYDLWERTSDFPEKMDLGEAALTAPEYQYAMCEALKALSTGATGDIEVFSYEAADSPDNDTYDKKTIALKGGPANGSQTEDLVNVAERMVKLMKLSGRVPNQTLYTRDGEPVAFGTTRATISIARALAAYAKSGSLEGEVSVLTKSPVGTIADFAREFVKILDVWEANVGTIYADSKHAGADAFREAHFIPTYSDYPDSDNNKSEETTLTIGEKTFTMDEAWELAITGIIELITKEGAGVVPTEVGVAAHTPGDGASMSTILYDPSKWERWTYPWYEADETLNLDENHPVTADLLVRLLPWWLKRANDFGYVGNFQYLHSLNFGDYSGMICSMRLLLIMARFYKEVLDAGIETGVYTYMKDKTIDPDLYGIIPVEKEYRNIDLDFVQDNKTGAILYKNATYFPSNGQAACNHPDYSGLKYNNFLKILEYNFQTEYDFQMWSRYGISRSTGSGLIRGLRFNPKGNQTVGTESVAYGGTDGGGWLKLPAIPGFKLIAVTFKLYSGTKYFSEMGTWHVVSGLTKSADGNSYSIASGATDFGTMSFSSSSPGSTVLLDGSEVNKSYYVFSPKTYNGELAEIHLEYESE